MPAQQLVEQLPATGKTVCVTGAGGYIASWLVKRLLEKGYTVKGTVRDPENPKNEHLKQLEGAMERLVLCRADVLDYDSLLTAMEGCDGLFHTAAPVGADDPKMVEPAVEGTRHAMRTAYAAGIRRVVYTSSIGTVYMNPHRADPDAPISDADWSDVDFCRTGGYWYCYAKTLAERAAWQYADEFGMRLSVVNPVLVLGPMLQSSVNASVAHVAKYLTGAVKTYANAVQAYVHVRDVVEAHVKVFESEKAAGGRYICAESSLHRGDVVEILGQLFPEYTVPTRCSDEVNPRKKPHRFDNQKLKDLGLTFTPVKQALYETVKSLQEKGHLPFVASADNCA